MRTLTGMSLVLFGFAGLALATTGPATVPEVDPGSAASALTVLIGVLLLRRRHRRPSREDLHA